MLWAFIIISFAHFHYIWSLSLLSEMTFLNIRASTWTWFVSSAIISNSNISRIKSFIRDFTRKLWLSKTVIHLHRRTRMTGDHLSIDVYTINECRWIREILHQSIRHRVARFLLSTSIMNLCHLISSVIFMTEDSHRSFVSKIKNFHQQYIKMSKDLYYIINHVFLFLKLSQKNDNDVTKTVSVIEELLTALELLQDRISEHERSEWISCIKTISNMLELRDHFEELMIEKLETTLRKMIDEDMNESVFENKTGI